MQTTLSVKVARADGLPKMDAVSKSDLYVVSSIQRLPENRVKTKTVWDNNNPVWDEDFELERVRLSDVVEFLVFDNDENQLLGRSDDFIGCALVNVDDVLTQGTFVQSLELTCKNGQPVGTLNVVMTVKNLGLVVTVHSACDLSSLDLFSESDPYAIVYVDGKESEHKKTKTVDNDNSPTWDEALGMGPVSSDEFLTIHVMDDDKWNGIGKPDDFIAHMTFNMGQALVVKNAPFDLPLETKSGEKTAATIKISLAVEEYAE